MRNRWLGLGLALMMAASAVPARAQYLVSPKGPACAPPDPIPFAPSMADAPPTEGEKELYGRLSEGVADRVKLVDQVEKTEYANVVKVTGSR